jgi:HEAT repeat protein
VTPSGVSPLTTGIDAGAMRPTIPPMRITIRAGVAVLAACAAVASGACKRKPQGPDVPALIADLKSEDPEKKGKASLRLIEVGEPAGPALAEMLKSESPAHRLTAASTLFGMGAKGRAAVPALAEALSDPDRELRVAAAMALESIGPDAAPAIPALVQALKDKEGLVRQRAVIALGSIGPAAQGAIPALVEAGKWDPVRGHVDEAIAKIRAR